MVDAVQNLVWETTESTASPYSLTTVAQSFNSAYGTGGTDKFFFGMYNQGAAGEWMVASGHLSAASTLVLDTVIEGSNGASEVAWSAGKKNIVCGIPADYQVRISRSDTAPTAPGEGDFWIRTTDMALFVYYNDGNSSQWVELGGGGGNPNILYDDLDGNGYSIINHLGTITNTATKETALENSAGDQVTPENQIHGLTYAQATQSISRWENGSNSGYVIFTKSRGTAINTHGVVSDNDYLGRISFDGDDGGNWVPGAEIRARVDGTPGTNDMPTRLELLTTADGASTSTVRATIAQDGGMWIGSTADQSQGAGTLNAESGLYDGANRVSWNLIASGTFSAASTLDFDFEGNSGYTDFMIVIRGCRLATGLGEIYLRTSANSGVSFDSAANDYEWGGIYSASSSTASSVDKSGGSGADHAETGCYLGSGTAYAGFLELTFFYPQSSATDYKMYRGRSVSSYSSSTGERYGGLCWGMRWDAGVVDQARLYPSASTFSGEYSLYGRRS